jgi:hypothetical protein
MSAQIYSPSFKENFDDLKYFFMVYSKTLSGSEIIWRWMK